ncbi:hypothetical protein KP77_34670 [Jeotgalibacillus alimentarius]|uniref:Glycoside-hydrolase family GH114 TIM-barrel domain-containing protein n=1 Tax=Jeotgalibacillus alimentarius TaxID=135826 RepID=A0A0C2V196_9BACL|nr:endo alpha-1,4 polygalactosaminidase [Jeotgalibacillus alimentarius]KIL42837.1 hypothetical protein KP77_34670 [Jeotgalibacillus alimentarius]
MKKWIIAFAVIVFGYVLLRGLMAVFFYGPLYRVDAFQIFYGNPDAEKLEELTRQDAAIIEPVAFTEDQVAHLKSKGVLTFGYVSLMQLENWNEELKQDLLPDDYWLQDGRQLYIEEWDTYIMNISNPHYRELLMRKISDEVAGKQMDGIFFDTVDDLDYYFREDQSAESELRAGYAQLLTDIESAYPNLLIIQNRGFESYKAVSRKRIDGMLWEGFDKQDIDESEWARNWRDYFKKEQYLGRVRIFTVVTDEASLKQSRRDRFPAFMRIGDTYQ